nr:hypothetical protein GCM10020092_035720 [Actinoplanes digitatis]
MPVEIPPLAFGRYAMGVDIGGLAVGRAHHQAYPWGLFVLNAAGVLLIVWGVLRRLRKRRRFAELSAADAVLLHGRAARRARRVPGLRRRPDGSTGCGATPAECSAPRGCGP